CSAASLHTWFCAPSETSEPRLSARTDDYYDDKQNSSPPDDYSKSACCSCCFSVTRDDVFVLVQNAWFSCVRACVCVRSCVCSGTTRRRCCVRSEDPVRPDKPSVTSPLYFLGLYVAFVHICHWNPERWEELSAPVVEFRQTR
ncbi:unnamed protein product, partial [Ixodes persulcatus]